MIQPAFFFLGVSAEAFRLRRNASAIVVAIRLWRIATTMAKPYKSRSPSAKKLSSAYEKSKEA